MKNSTNLMRKIIMFVFVIVFTCNSFGISIVYANEEGENRSNPAINDSVYYCLCAAGLDMSKEYYISEEFEVQNSDNWETMLFVFCEQKCEGEILLSANDAGCAFFREKREDITELLEKKEAIAVVRTDLEHIYVVSENGENRLCIYGALNNGGKCLYDPNNYAEITCQYIISDNVMGDRSNRIVIDDHCYRNVPIFANDYSPDTGNQICWAACILSMLRYKNKTTITTPVGLYNALKAYYCAPDDDPPEGTHVWIQRAFEHYGYSITAYSISSGLTFSSVKDCIDSNKPIYASLSINSSALSGHAVVVCGYSCFSNTGLITYYHYRLMDPDAPSDYVTVTVPGTGTNFTYGNYTVWRRYYY